LDSHCHLTADRFAGDREEVLERASRAGVDTIIAIGSGYGVKGNAEAAALAAGDRRLFATAGVHPHEASELDDRGRRQVRECLDQPRVVAVGECGIDYHYMHAPREVQRSVFAEQLALARELDLPVVIHARADEPRAYDELLEIWLAEGRGELQGVLHCYTGPRDFAHRALDAGLYVSLSGILTFKKSGELRETARELPLERLLVETDAPFLAPQGHRGKRNEPAWVRAVGETLAGLHQLPVDQVARATQQNARSLFRLPDPD
jgi:TatD DNase family protein